jgi:hypothetical protein
MKSLNCCIPRQSVLDGSEDFVVNLSALTDLSQPEAEEFLDANVLTSGMEQLVMQAFDRLNGGPSRGIFKLSESMGGGKTQSMIVAGLLARFPKLAKPLPFKTQAQVPSRTPSRRAVSNRGRLRSAQTLRANRSRSSVDSSAVEVNPAPKRFPN